MADESWVERAACREADLELFYSEIDDDEQAALAYCRTCEVRAECYEAAMSRRETYGVWGGTVGRQRRRTFRRQRRGSRSHRPRQPAETTAQDSDTSAA